MAFSVKAWAWDGSVDDAVLTNRDRILAIESVSEVSAGIFRGPRPSVEAVQSLAAAGIRLILNLQGGDLNTPRWYGLLSEIIHYTEPGELETTREAERLEAANQQIDFVNIPLSSVDPVDDEEAQQIQRILALIHSLKNVPIYVHCEHGRDRTGLIVALYRVRFEGWSVESAYQEWREMGHKGFWNWLITGSLDSYFFTAASSLSAQRRTACESFLVAPAHVAPQGD